MKIKKKSPLVLLGLISLLMSCSHNKEADKKAELEKLKKQQAELKAKISILETDLNSNDSLELNKGIVISVTSLKQEIFKNYIDVQGRVDADENVMISTEMPGTINKINVKSGDVVSAGQVLAETDARAISQTISDLQTNFELVNQIYLKQKNLWEQKIGTEIQFLQAKTNKESLEKKINTLQEQLRMSKIIAPISGTIDAVDIKIGQMAAPGIPAIRIINYSSMKVKAELAESYASKIHKGSEVIIRFPDMEDTIISTITFVSRAINPNTRTFTVEVLLDIKKEYYPNMVAKLNIGEYSSPQPVCVIPVNIIQKDENNASFVFVALDNKVQKRMVSIGKQYKGKSEIIAGLREGDLLISGGYNLVNENDLVNYKK